MTTIRDLLVIEELCQHNRTSPHGYHPFSGMACTGPKTRSANLDDLDALLDVEAGVQAAITAAHEAALIEDGVRAVLKAAVGGAT